MAPSISTECLPKIPIIDIWDISFHTPIQLLVVGLV